jgi:hypothetical protein
MLVGVRLGDVKLSRSFEGLMEIPDQVKGPVKYRIQQANMQCLLHVE